jgi:transposase-like protein
MPSYSEERKQAVLNKLLPPSNMTVAHVAREEGIGLQTLVQLAKQSQATRSTCNTPIFRSNYS